jgi:hypothetical protein
VRSAGRGGGAAELGRRLLTAPGLNERMDLRPLLFLTSRILASIDASAATARYMTVTSPTLRPRACGASMPSERALMGLSLIPTVTQCMLKEGENP